MASSVLCGCGVRGRTKDPLHLSSNRCVKLPGLKQGKAKDVLHLNMGRKHIPYILVFYCLCDVLVYFLYR